MKLKKFIVLFVAAALVFSLAACGSNEKDSQETSTEYITVVDHLDKTVNVPVDAKRIVVCDIYPLPSVLSVFFDSAENIVGMAPPSMSAAENSLLSSLYPEILNANTDFINGTEVNIEELIKLKPDVVFYSASSAELGEQLTQAGFNAVAVSVNKWEYNAIETLNNWIKLISQIFPAQDKTEKVAEYSNEVYDMIQERLAQLPEEDIVSSFFLFNYDESGITTSGKQFFGQWWADASGSKNVGEELEQDNSINVNMEQVYAWNPQVIFITNFTSAQPEDIMNNTIGNYDWSEIDAVKNGRVYKMPLGIYRSYTPGADTPMTLLWFVKTTYPELFEDIDLTQEVKDYYLELYGIELTDEQVERIFSPASEAAGGLSAS